MDRILNYHSGLSQLLFACLFSFIVYDLLFFVCMFAARSAMQFGEYKYSICDQMERSERDPAHASHENLLFLSFPTYALFIFVLFCMM